MYLMKSLKLFKLKARAKVKKVLKSKNFEKLRIKKPQKFLKAQNARKARMARMARKPRKPLKLERLKLEKTAKK